MQARADFFPATDSTILTNITLQFERKDLQFKQKEGVAKALVNIYARITSMARRVVNVFEDVVTIEVPTELLQQASQGHSIYQKSVPLPPGMYRLNVVAKDIVGGNMNNYEMALNVPRMEEDKLFASSLILADLIEKVPTKQHRYRPVRDRHLQGPPALRRQLQARREDGHLHAALQLRAG